jgi:hypothetical protein
VLRIERDVQAVAAFLHVNSGLYGPARNVQAPHGSPARAVVLTSPMSPARLRGRPGGLQLRPGEDGCGTVSDIQPLGRSRVPSQGGTHS